MTETLAQLISIVSYGNEYLEKEILQNYYPKNSTFQHCNFVDFRELKKKYFFSNQKEFIVAKNPIDWYVFLKSKKCKKLRLYYQSEKKDDHKTASFIGGGGTWLIETVFENYSDFWFSIWKYDKNSIKKPWQVTYGKDLSNQPIINQQYTIEKTKEALKICLEKIIDFAYKETDEYWAKKFQQAIYTLNSDKPELNFHHFDLIIWNNYDLQNKQLLMAACHSFVFGGMGSWNDMSFQNEATEEMYHILSSKLYITMMKSIVYAVNKDILE